MGDRVISLVGLALTGGAGATLGAIGWSLPARLIVFVAVRAVAVTAPQCGGTDIVDCLVQNSPYWMAAVALFAAALIGGYAALLVLGSTLAIVGGIRFMKGRNPWLMLVLAGFGSTLAAPAFRVLIELAFGVLTDALS